MRSLRLAAVVVLLVPGCVVNLPYFEGELGAIAPKLNADARLASASGTSGGKVSADRDLGLGERELGPYGAVRLGGAGLNGSLSAFSVAADGNGVLTKSFGELPAGSQVDSSFDITDAKATATLDLLNLGPVRLAAGAGLERVDIDLEADSGTTRETIESTSQVPVIVAEGELGLGPIRVQASAAGMTGEWQDVSGPFLDGELSLRLKPFPFLEFFIGYRYLSFDIEGRDAGRQFDVDLTLSGYLAGATMRF